MRAFVELGFFEKLAVYGGVGGVLAVGGCASSHIQAGPQEQRIEIGEAVSAGLYEEQPELTHAEERLSLESMQLMSQAAFLLSTSPDLSEAEIDTIVKDIAESLATELDDEQSFEVDDGSLFSGFGEENVVYPPREECPPLNSYVYKNNYGWPTVRIESCVPNGIQRTIEAQSAVLENDIEDSAWIRGLSAFLGGFALVGGIHLASIANNRQTTVTGGTETTKL